MSEYSFVTLWRLEAPIDPVYEWVDEGASA
jgi:hypothetical protein